MVDRLVEKLLFLTIMFNPSYNPQHFLSDETRFGKLVDEYLHDFDIFHLAHATELLHYIDPKYLSVELGGSRPVDLDTWMVVQQNVDAFTLRNAQHFLFLFSTTAHLSLTACLKIEYQYI